MKSKYRNNLKQKLPKILQKWWAILFVGFLLSAAIVLQNLSLSPENIAADKTPNKGTHAQATLNSCNLTVTYNSNVFPAPTLREYDNGQDGQNDWFILSFGADIYQPVVSVECRRVDPILNMNLGGGIDFFDPEYNVGIQAGEVSQVDPIDYPIFDKATRDSIEKLFSAQDKGYRAGSETLSFAKNGFLYMFQFENPPNQETAENIIISVTE